MFVICKTQKITLTLPFRCKEAPISPLSDRRYCFKLIIKAAFWGHNCATGGCVVLNALSGPRRSVPIRYQTPKPIVLGWGRTVTANCFMIVVIGVWFSTDVGLGGASGGWGCLSACAAEAEADANMSCHKPQWKSNRHIDWFRLAVIDSKQRSLMRQGEWSHIFPASVCPTRQ